MSQEVKVIKYQALQYGKSYQQCLDIVKFVKQYSPDTKFELVSGASDFDRVKKELEECKAKLKIATEALKTIHIGEDPRNSEWSEQFQENMFKCFTAKTASDYANEILKQLEEK